MMEFETIMLIPVRTKMVPATYLQGSLHSTNKIKKITNNKLITHPIMIPNFISSYLNELGSLEPFGVLVVRTVKKIPNRWI